MAGAGSRFLRKDDRGDVRDEALVAVVDKRGAEVFKLPASCRPRGALVSIAATDLRVDIGNDHVPEERSDGREPRDRFLGLGVLRCNVVEIDADHVGDGYLIGVTAAPSARLLGGELL